MRRYPEVEVTVRPGQPHDLILVDLELEGRPDIQLIWADDSAIATAIVGRYTFDNLEVNSLFDFLVNIYESKFALKTRKFPWHSVTLTVPYGGRAYPVTARWYPGDLEQWEIEGLSRPQSAR